MWSYPVLLDARQVAEQYGVGGLPTTVLIDREGRIAGYHVGYGAGMEKRLEAELHALLAKGGGVPPSPQ